MAWVKLDNYIKKHKQSMLPDYVNLDGYFDKPLWLQRHIRHVVYRDSKGCETCASMGVCPHCAGFECEECEHHAGFCECVGLAPYEIEDYKKRR